MKCGVHSEIEQAKNDAEPDCQEGGAFLILDQVEALLRNRGSGG
jgi:hypothetical protein